MQMFDSIVCLGAHIICNWMYLIAYTHSIVIPIRMHSLACIRPLLVSATEHVWL